MDLLEIERLADEDLRLIKPLLVELQLHEQQHYSDHPQLSASQIETALEVQPAFFQVGTMTLEAVVRQDRPDVAAVGNVLGPSSRGEEQPSWSNATSRPPLAAANCSAPARPSAAPANAAASAAA